MYLNIYMRPALHLSTMNKIDIAVLGKTPLDDEKKTP